MSNIVFRYKWRGPNSGWYHYMEITPASMTVIDPLLKEIRYLPDNCIKLQEVNYEMNWMLYGLQETPNMKLEIDFNLIPDDAYYEEFYDAIFNPYVLGQQNGYTQKRYKLSTIFRWVPQRQDIEDPLDDLLSTYDEFYGLMRKMSGNNINFVENKCTVEVYDINRWILEALQLDMSYTVLADPAYTPDIVSRTGCIEYAYLKSGVYYAVGHAANFKFHDTFRFWFIPRENYLDFLRATALILKKEMLRDGTYSSYYIGTPNTWYYKQNYSGDGTLGTLLNNNEIYLLAAYADGDYDGSDQKIDGLFVNGSSRYIYNDYKNGAWDFLNELYQDGLTKCLLSPDGGVSNVPLFWFADSAITIDKERIWNFKPVNFDEAVKSMTSSLYESTGKDINKFEEFGAGSFNEFADTVPIVFNNMPAACPYYPNDFTYIDALKIKDPNLLKMNVVPHKSENINNIHHRGLYYMEESSVIKTGSGTMPFRVHEYCETPIGPLGEETDALDGCDFTAYPVSGLTWDQPTENIQYLQSVSCKPRFQAKALAGLWGDDERIMLIEFDVPFQERFGTSAKFLFGRDGFTRMFTFNMVSEINSHYPGGYYDSWFMYKVKLDCEKEIATVSLITKPY